MSPEAAIQTEEKAAIDGCLSADQQDGFAAFPEKREPRWSGR